MMKINFVVYSFNQDNTGGVTRVVANLANQFCKHSDMSVTIYSLSECSSLAFEIDQNINLKPLDMEFYTPKQYSGFRKILWVFNIFKKLEYIVKEEKDAIWLSTSTPFNVVFGLIKMKYPDIKVIGCEHTSTVYSKGLLFDKLKSFFLKKLNYTIALTKQDKEYYEKIGINNVEVIPNSISSELFINHFNFQRKYVIYVGRFEEEKQPLLALDVYQKSKLFEKGISLKMFGAGSQLENIKDYIQQNKLEDYVELISGENRIDKIYNNAYALLLTSKVEGFPMVILESIARNVPVLSFDVPYGPRNIIQHHKNGFLIEPYDVETYCSYLLSSELKEIHNQDISYTVTSFTDSKILKLWLDLFKKVLYEII
ncbi:glycosyltransferase [Glaesserella parasuis]|uniref:Aminodeoxychorismate lyase n=1 Tax=Glaesserella parasuis TaxID=738 RepID=T1RNZ6_GLAPU|nr:aminodeoxychorismate lyase [Glaesserella parasuis]MDD2169058.1 glycosyltransferase [Glaesserella parasuis]MDP0310332.1 glycosyltransferase [Glaesserella parasuis]MDP0329970.1 glycosyltransferase [Glaesserella parasuis]MDP0392008.1 glycosyltransferase [Glaesserella parasuis]